MITLYGWWRRLKVRYRCPETMGRHDWVIVHQYDHDRRCVACGMTD